jgi:hypothetical protein
VRRAIASLLVVSLLVGTTAPLARGEDENPLAKKKRDAIAKGVDWLKKQQDKDGEWDYDDKPFKLGSVGAHLMQGVTALCAFALLKAGVEPKDPAIAKAFDMMRKRPVEHVYSAGCVLLAIEAKVNWEPLEGTEPEPAKEGGSQAKGAKTPKGPGKPDAADLELAKKCVEFLERGQKKRSWRYSGEPDEDASNPQYALLGLDAAERMGLPVGKGVYEKAAEYFIDLQEKDGPEVPVFEVIGADKSYLELKKIEKELQDKIRKIGSGFKGKKPGETDKEGHSEDDLKRLAEEEAAKKATGKTVEKAGPKGPEKMFARGWKYGAKGEAWTQLITGSMTASGCACLFICKAHLEGTPKYEKELKGPLVKALRDGCAWLSSRFTVGENPGNGLHHYYYLYGLERAGILGLVTLLGPHDWYTDGSAHFLQNQQADGKWQARAGTSGPVVDTCFALLFLARGTTPLVKLPERTATGAGR